MKLVSICILTALMFALSCNKDDTNQNDDDYFLSVKIDGVDFTSSNNVVVTSLANLTGFYTITSVGDSQFVLTLPGPIATGTFMPTEGEITSLAYQESSPIEVWATSENIGSGTISITDNNTDFLTGTFSFTGLNQGDNTEKVFTEGSFKARKL